MNILDPLLLLLYHCDRLRRLPNPRSPGTHIVGPWVTDNIYLYRDVRTGTQYIGNWASRVTLRVQVPNNHILTQNLYYSYYYQTPKYLIIGYLDPKGNVFLAEAA